MMKVLWSVCLAVVMNTACTASHDEVARTAVTEQNELGVVALEVERFEQGAESGVELRAFDAVGNEVGSLRLRLGEIPELDGADRTGSELVVNVGSVQHRQVSRERTSFVLSGSFAPAIEQFLSIKQVAVAASNEGILVTYTAQPAEDAYNSGGSCSAGQLNTTPVAKQCCTYWAWSGSIFSGSDMVMVTFTRFVNPSNQVVLREQRYGSCKSSSGGSCSGTNCYYGPNGFSRPQLVSGSGYPKIWVNASQDCEYQFYGSPQAAVLPDVTGTYPGGQGCCVNGSGPCGSGTATACSACGGGGSAGQGAWDY